MKVPSADDLMNALVEWSRAQHDPDKLTPYQLRSLSDGIRQTLLLNDREEILRKRRNQQNMR